MKKTHVKLLVVVSSLALVAACFLPPLPTTKRHATKIHTVNSVSSITLSIDTNVWANRLTQKH